MSTVMTIPPSVSKSIPSSCLCHYQFSGGVVMMMTVINISCKLSSSLNNFSLLNFLVLFQVPNIPHIIGRRLRFACSILLSNNHWYSRTLRESFQLRGCSFHVLKGDERFLCKSFSFVSSNRFISLLSPSSSYSSCREDLRNYCSCPLPLFFFRTPRTQTNPARAHLLRCSHFHRLHHLFPTSL